MCLRCIRGEFVKREDSRWDIHNIELCNRSMLVFYS
jgi:hypothetical protein